MYKRLYRTGIAAYGVLFILSFLFYKERTVFLDAAYDLFFIIKDNRFEIQNCRFTALFTQVLPLMASRLGAPLDTIAILYSTGFIVYYFVCYFICGTVLKQYRFALVILLFNILFTAHTFYWMPSKLPQGIVLFIVLAAFMSDRKMSEMNVFMLLMIFLGLFTVCFSQPKLFFPFTYLFLYLLIRKEIIIERKLIYVAAIFFYALIQLKNKVFAPHDRMLDYDSARSILRSFPHIFNLYSNKSFLINCLTIYYWIPILSAVIVWVYVKGREWKQLVLFACSMPGYLLLMNISYPGADIPVFNMENYYLPMAIFIAIPLVFDVMPLLAERKLAMPLLVLIILTGCARIFFVHQSYSDRLVWERNLLNKYQDKKVIIAGAKMPIGMDMMIWGIPYECWLLSTIEKGKTASIIIYDGTQPIDWGTGYSNRFLITWDALPYDSFPKKYFKFEDSVSKYVVIP